MTKLYNVLAVQTFSQIEDDLNFFKMEENFRKFKTNLNLKLMEDQPNTFPNGR